MGAPPTLSYPQVRNGTTLSCTLCLNRPWKRSNRESITELLQHLNWSTLETQQKNARLTLLFKVINHILIIPTEYLPIESSSSITRAQHKLKFMHYQTFVDNYRYSFFPRTVPHWKNLTICNIEKIDIETFKNLLIN